MNGLLIETASAATSLVVWKTCLNDEGRMGGMFGVSLALDQIVPRLEMWGLSPPKAG